MNGSNDNKISASRRRHNPKSHSPAVYIPCWLIQISVQLLSHGAKLLYGRLSQWSSELGTVYRSIPDLSQELGMCESSVEKFLKELKTVGLIGTFHPQAGGVNHYEFYDHEWMHEPLKEQLTYKSNNKDTEEIPAIPPVCSYGTPPYNYTDINIKEIKETKPLKPYGDFDKSTSHKEDDFFMSWYSIYPNKEKPSVARKAFYKLKPTPEFVEMIIEDVKQRLENNWKNRPKDKIPHPSTYLNESQWEGEIYAPSTNVTSFPNKPPRYTMDELTKDLL